MSFFPTVTVQRVVQDYIDRVRGADGRDQLLDAVLRVLDSDYSTTVLVDAIVGSFYTALERGHDYRLLDVQKKDNIMYMRSLSIYKNATIDGIEEPSDVYIDHELLYIDHGDAPTIVRISVPSTDMRAEVYKWPWELISSLRVEY